MVKELQKFDPEKAKERLLSTIGFPNNKDALLKELSEDIIPKCLDKDNPEHENALKRFGDKSISYMRIFENESHVGLMESFNESYRMLSFEMTKTMISDFNCSNEAEKALVELIVNAYVRTIDNSRRLNNELECRNITTNRNIYIANLSKQIDRANRQFISNLLTLKQLKSPQIEINIKANNAFVSNNQQINLNKNENIKG
jgi:hypothetical protein